MCRFLQGGFNKLNIYRVYFAPQPAEFDEDDFEKLFAKKKERGKYQPFVSSVKNLFSVQIDTKGKNLYYLSNGKIGKRMKEIERDAVPRKGLILDLRYDSGGNVHDRVINDLTHNLLGDDPQLDKAIEAILGEIGEK